MPKNWKKEIARDTLALGSIPFYVLVTARAFVGKYPIFIYQLLISIIIIFVLSIIIKNSQLHVARALVLVFFTGLFYKDLTYTIFTIFIFIIMIVSCFYLKEKKVAIAKGFLLGIVSSLFGYYLAGFI